MHKLIHVSCYRAIKTCNEGNIIMFQYSRKYHDNQIYQRQHRYIWCPGAENKHFGPPAWYKSDSNYIKTRFHMSRIDIILFIWYVVIVLLCFVSLQTFSFKKTHLKMSHQNASASVSALMIYSTLLSQVLRICVHVCLNKEMSLIRHQVIIQINTYACLVNPSYTNMMLIFSDA